MATDNEDIFAAAERDIELNQRIEQTIARIEKTLADSGFELEVTSETDAAYLDEQEFLLYEGRRFAAAKLNLKIQFVASLMIMAQLVHEDDEESGNTSELYDELRLGIIRDLWLDGDWVEPWITIANQEIPGESLNADDYESFIKAAADKAISSVDNRVKFEELHTGILDLLNAGGYLMEPIDAHESDHLLVLLLITQTWSKDIETRKAFEARQLVRKHATAPDHPAWQVVIESYLTN